MKKILSLSVFISLLFVASTAQACSISGGASFPSITDTINSGDVNLMVLRAESEGSLVVAKNIFSRSQTSEYVVLSLPGDSCRDRHDNFEKGEYLVVLSPRSQEHVVTFSSLDSQFTFKAKDEADAMKIYQNLEKTFPRFTQSDLDANADYVVYGPTLRPKMKQKEVAFLQQAIKKALSNTEFIVDGSYGPKTTALVKKYQESRALFADGLAGKKTQQALADNLAAVNSDDSAIVKQDATPMDDKKDTVKETESTDTEISPEKNLALVDANIVALLKEAKVKVEMYKKGKGSYLQAHEVIVPYNNSILDESKSSDPLFKSSNGGDHFVYLAKLLSGKIACVDDTGSAEYVEIASSPSFEKEILSCL